MSLFGDRSLRLLRENWKSPRALAEELYAMFTAREPVEFRDTVTIRVPEGKPALRIERAGPDPGPDPIAAPGSPSRPAQARAADAARRRRPWSEPDSARRTQAGEDSRRPIAGVDRPAGDGPPPRRPGNEAPLVEFDGPVRFGGDAPVQFSRPPVLVNPQTGEREEYLPPGRDDGTLADRLDRWAKKGGAGGVPVAGVVCNDDPNDRRAFIYSSPTDATPISDDQGVPVPCPFRVPMLAEGEIVPLDHVLFPMWKVGGEYWCQLPLWGS